MAINELVVAYPLWSLGIISLFITLVSTLAHKWLTNQEQMTNLKKRQKEIQKQLNSKIENIGNKYLIVGEGC